MCVLLHNKYAPTENRVRHDVRTRVVAIAIRLGGARLNQTGQDGLNMFHLIVVDGVTHARIDAFGQVAAQAAKHRR
jgi:hypothetical protein